MTGPITTELHDDILVIISNNPPVNALGAAVRQGLEAGIKGGGWRTMRSRRWSFAAMAVRSSPAPT